MKKPNNNVKWILGALGLIVLAGCATEYNLATQKEEVLFYDEEKEINLGYKVSQSIESKLKMNTNVDDNERVQKILDRLVAVSDRTDLVYFIKIIDEEPINAISLPGGYIYVFQGLLDAVDNDDQLASVIAHEVAHITAKHGVKRLQNSYGALLLQLASIESKSADFARGVNVALTSLFMEHSQKAEFEADRLGVKYMKAAGFDVNEMPKMLQTLQDEADKKGPNPYSYWRTHPFISQRIGLVNSEIKGKMEYRDYIKLLGAEDKAY